MRWMLDICQGAEEGDASFTGHRLGQQGLACTSAPSDLSLESLGVQGLGFRVTEES